MNHAEPLFTHLLIEEMERDAKNPKPTALDTPLRYSGAYGCARQWGYYAFDGEPSDPVSAAAAWRMGRGTMSHERNQAAILRAYPKAKFEVASGLTGAPVAMEGGPEGPVVSGSADALVMDSPLGNAVWELKNKGQYPFWKAVGWKDKGFGKIEWTAPEGPSRSDIAQAALNALGIEETYGTVIDVLVIGYIAVEPLSERLALQLGVDPYSLDCVMREWHIPREEFVQIGQEEASRMMEAADDITQGYLPPRIAMDDYGREVELDPNASRPPWQCDYCTFAATCRSDGRGRVWVNDSHTIKRETANAE